MAITPTKLIIRKKHTVPADNTNNFFKSKFGSERVNTSYLRLVSMSVKPKRREASRRHTVKRSTEMVTVGSELRSMLLSCCRESGYFLAGISPTYSFPLFEFREDLLAILIIVAMAMTVLCNSMMHIQSRT